MWAVIVIWVVFGLFVFGPFVPLGSARRRPPRRGRLRLDDAGLGAERCSAASRHPVPSGPAPAAGAVALACSPRSRCRWRSDRRWPCWSRATLWAAVLGVLVGDVVDQRADPRPARGAQPGHRVRAGGFGLRGRGRSGPGRPGRVGGRPRDLLLLSTAVTVGGVRGGPAHPRSADCAAPGSTVHRHLAADEVISAFRGLPCHVSAGLSRRWSLEAAGSPAPTRTISGSSPERSRPWSARCRTRRR